MSRDGDDNDDDERTEKIKRWQNLPGIEIKLSGVCCSLLGKRLIHLSNSK